MKSAMVAVIKKDVRGITANRHLFTGLLVVPLVLTIFVPTIFFVTIHFAPEDDPSILKILEIFPQAAYSENFEMTFAGFLLNYIMPVFFLIIPIMCASVMAASSFVGEKEKHTLETLLYCPLSLRQIFCAKVMASFLLSMAVSLGSFCVMLAVLETEAVFLIGGFLLPGISWLLILLLVAPGISLLAITLIVRGSAKAHSVEEAQQGAVFLVLPIVLMAAGQFTGILLLNEWIVLGVGMVCMLLAGLFLKKCMGRFTYEALLK